MKNVSRIFSAVMCSASLFAFDACGAVATTAGSNLTAYNPSNSYNNQWATMTNPRYDGTVSAKADFGNCNAVVLRCAQPKCANGGCGEMNVAAAIVSGCVKSNDKCKQYGDDLINYMTAQLVASSQAKINASNAEQIQAAQQAAQQAQAAAQQAQMAQQQQMAEMQSSMQQQMQQMQQQMAEQSAQSAQAIADALAASQQQQQQAISEMKSAATTAAQVQMTGTVITQDDKEAISRGVSEDVLLRNTISGQINTALDDAKTSLDEVKAAMKTSFEYAGCDNRGDNCTGPKRVKKWRELALEFIDPYDKVVDNISEALDIAQVVGVDLNDIYMMLNNSCNQWGQYMCPGGGQITYDTDPKTGQKGAPSVCEGKSTDEAKYFECADGCEDDEFATTGKDYECLQRCLHKSRVNLCKPCTLLKLYSNKDKEEVYDMWVQTEGKSEANQVIVACASSAMKTGLLARQAKRKSGAGTLDVSVLEDWINYHESNTTKNNEKDKSDVKYCAPIGDDGEARKSLSSRTVKVEKLCKGGKSDDDYCDVVNPEYAICDTHPWNAGYDKTDNLKSDEIEKIKTKVGEKTTLVSQQLYKQYEYLRATLKRLETSLDKSVLAAQLEKAGASSDSSSGGSGSSRSNDRAVVLAGAENCFNSSSPTTAYTCIQNNANLIKSNVKTNRKNAKEQLKQTVEAAGLWGIDLCSQYITTTDKNDPNKKEVVCKEGNPCSPFPNDDAGVTKCANALSIGTARKMADEQKQQQQYYRPY